MGRMELVDPLKGKELISLLGLDIKEEPFDFDLKYPIEQGGRGGSDHHDDEEEQQGSNLVLGIQSVYNNEVEGGGVGRLGQPRTTATKQHTTTITTTASQPNDLIKLKCTGWRCKKCGQDFPSQSDIITHVKQKSCVHQGRPSSLKLTSTLADDDDPRKKKMKKKNETKKQKTHLNNFPRTSSKSNRKSNQNPNEAKNEDKEDKTRVAAKTPAKRKRISCETLTPEEARAVRLKKQAEATRLRRARLSEEKRAEVLRRNAEAQRLRRLNLNDEERAAFRRRDAESHRVRLQNLSEGQRAELRRRRRAEAQRRRRARMSEEQFAAARKKGAENYRARLQNLSEEERAEKRRKHAEAERLRCMNLSQEERTLQRKIHADRERHRRLSMKGQQGPGRYQRLKLAHTKEEWEARCKKDKERNKLRKRVKESEEVAALIEQMAQAGGQKNNLDNPDPGDDDKSSEKLSQWTLAAMLENIRIIPSTKTTTSSSKSINQDSDDPIQCSICKKTLPLKYMQYHYNYHAELEFEKTGIWREPQRLNDVVVHTGSEVEGKDKDSADAAAGEELLLFNCSTCESSFSRKFLLQMHVNQAHESNSSSSSSSQPHCCSSCHKTFKDMATLNKHTNKLHSNTVKVKL